MSPLFAWFAGGFTGMFIAYLVIQLADQFVRARNRSRNEP